MTWLCVAKMSDVPSGAAFKVTVNGLAVALFHVDGQVFATQDLCTHGSASLSEGYIDGDYIECPLHQGIFHIPSGTCRGGPVSENLRVYPVKIEGDYIFVETA